MKYCVRYDCMDGNRWTSRLRAYNTLTSKEQHLFKNIRRKMCVRSRVPSREDMKT